MRYAGLIKNDVANGVNVCVSLFVQGCHLHCKGCHNPESWCFDGGKKYTKETEQLILSSLQANGVQRNLSLLGGEPLCEENASEVLSLMKKAKQQCPNIKIFCWTGYLYEDLQQSQNQDIRECLNYIDVLIDGPFILEKRDITLPLRGSSNQRIINLTNEKKYDII